LQLFEKVLSTDAIDINELRKHCFNGIPDSNGLRPLCWKILLGYLDTNRKSWHETLSFKRSLYNQYISEMVVLPSLLQAECIDHPLSEGPDSKWNIFFKDNEFLLQIDKDVRRLYPDISFFQQPTEFPCNLVVKNNDERRLHQRVVPSKFSSANVERKGVGMTKINLITNRSQNDYEALDEGQEAHWEVVQRILFIYAKLNPGQGYVQGMNEIIGPIYYIMASNQNIEEKEHAEADSFFCFTLLMSEIRDFFIKTLDNSETGINFMMCKLTEILKIKAPNIHNLLMEQEIHSQYFSF
uniref:Rab-GAP TBC domain-containing protein n=1 Tax=Megaselia scalaris TaxID=36166 RepID=T1H6D8_MEGSC